MSRLEGLFCSFFGMNQEAVRKLIAGGGSVKAIPGRRPDRTLPVVSICDECVAFCNEIIDSENSAKPPS